MDRRAFIANVVIGVAAAPRLGWTQQPRYIYRIGIPTSGINPRSAPFFVAFEQRLRELGWVDAQNVAIQFWDYKPEQISDVAAKMVGAKVDVILTGGPDLFLRAAAQATRTIPVGERIDKRAYPRGTGRPTRRAAEKLGAP